VLSLGIKYLKKKGVSKIFPTCHSKIDKGDIRIADVKKMKTRVTYLNQKTVGGFFL
jgi:hypothetical protein